ncbi:MAG: hypothetical protein WKF84_07025 [Pyrinomonadaceae bacterium]
MTINSADRKYTLGEARRSVQSQTGYSVESLTSSIPYEDFVRIAQSQDIRLRLGLTEIKLNSDQMTILRVAASYMAP